MVDGIVGEVLFWTLKEVLGEETYTSQVHFAYVRIFSRMLSVIVPIAVSFEISTGGHNQRVRIDNEHALQRDRLDVQASLPREGESVPASNVDDSSIANPPTCDP